MDTKPLERFATRARRELINAVDAQATAVLSVGSVARSERAEVVKKLEAEVLRHGRQHVVDKVAYTWFNRIIALRFMDARGYTDAAVVSPVRGQTHGQPEILSDAKRGNLDTDVVANIHTANAIIGLLDGTRRSTDAEGEAYALLLTEYCRYWHKPMPFMFEREGDYTELLVPANLLADGAILARAREVLTEDVCDDVEVIGWLYQFYISERKNEVFEGFKAQGNARKLAGPDEIPAATQLFTPHWIVRYLVENSLGRLWVLNHPSSRLVEQMDYFIAVADEETHFLKIGKPEEITVIDPACGSGHMLTYAFDLLFAIYEEEGYASSDIPSLILANNLHGAEIDSRAGSLAAFALTMKARAKDRRFFNKDAVPKIFAIEPISFGHDELEFLRTNDGDPHAEDAFWNQFRDADTLGSLIQPDVELTKRAVVTLASLDGGDDIIHGRTLELARKAVAQALALSRTYSVVTANPPYMGSKNMDTRLTSFAKDRFPDSKSDLFAMFVERCLDFVPVDGYVGLMTPFVWMFIASYDELRRRVVERETISSLIQLEYSGFDGATVPICTCVLKRGRSSQIGAFVRLSDFVGPAVQGPRALEIISADRLYRSNEETTGMERHLYRVAMSQFSKVPGSPIAYWLSDAMRSTFTRFVALSSRSRSAKGLVTADNASFVRFWWETSNTRIGFGYEDRGGASESGKRWFPYAKGGDFRRWAGNLDSVVDWEADGHRIQTTLTPDGTRVRATNFNLDRIFKPAIAWTVVTSGAQSFRFVPAGSLFDAAAGMCQSMTDEVHLALLNSSVASQLLATINPTLNLHPGYLGAVPVPSAVDGEQCRLNARAAVAASTDDWDDFETSWAFERSSLLGNPNAQSIPLMAQVTDWSARQSATALEQQSRETLNNRMIAHAYQLEDEVQIEVPLERVSLTRNVKFRHGEGRSSSDYESLEREGVVSEIVSYAVGCIFGRFSFDEPGLILADQGETLQDYLAKVPIPSFMPDADNVIPFVDDGWFEDDIVERFRQFLRAVFGAKYFEQNLRFVEESLGVKTLRDYFITKAGKSKFYNDHVQRYKKRPIYWMFSSPKGSFNALIYMHRYTPSTVSTVLNEYLREYRSKLEVALANAEQAVARGESAKEQKEADRLRKVLMELAEYEHDVLYPLASQQIVIDLDDGVRANYPKFYPALKNIAGLESTQ